MSRSKDETTKTDSESVTISAKNNLDENVKLFQEKKGEAGDEVTSFQFETNDNFKDHEKNLEVKNDTDIAVEEAELVDSEEEIAKDRSEAMLNLKLIIQDSYIFPQVLQIGLKIRRKMQLKTISNFMCRNITLLALCHSDLLIFWLFANMI